jgi:UDP-glucose 4-epimerase
MKILVTGGAGYIGSVVSAYFLDRGFEVRILDDLSTGNKFAIDNRAEFVHGSILNASDVRKSLIDCDLVIHLAGKALVEESINNPHLYMSINYEGTKNLLEIMNELKINKIFFSSTCSVYGNTNDDKIDEDSKIDPINPYAESKLKADQIIEAFSETYKINAVSFRFFNVSGAYKSKTNQLFGESHRIETHLIPNLINWKEKGNFTIYGVDWDTEDGTCIRDYVHVTDIAEAFYLATINKLENKYYQFNLGTQKGYSIKEVIKSVEKITSDKINIIYGERRVGDPRKLVANSNKAKEQLGWIAKNTLDNTIQDSLEYFLILKHSDFEASN